MKFTWVYVAALVVVVMGTGMGCADNDKSVVILFNIAPTDECTVTVQKSGSDAVFYSQGLFDLKIASQYIMHLQIENYMPNNYNKSAGDLDSMAVQIEYAEITYSWVGGKNIIGDWDEINEKFIPENNEIIDELIDEHWKMHPELPLIIQICKTKIEGKYHSYRSFGIPDKRTIVNLKKQQS